MADKTPIYEDPSRRSQDPVGSNQQQHDVEEEHQLLVEQTQESVNNAPIQTSFSIAESDDPMRQGVMQDRPSEILGTEDQPLTSQTTSGEETTLPSGSEQKGSIVPPQTQNENNALPDEQTTTEPQSLEGGLSSTPTPQQQEETVSNEEESTSSVSNSSVHRGNSEEADALNNLLNGIQETQTREADATNTPTNQDSNTTPQTTPPTNTTVPQVSQETAPPQQNSGGEDSEDVEMNPVSQNTNVQQPSPQGNQQTTTASANGYLDQLGVPATPTGEQRVQALIGRAVATYRRAGLAVGRGVGFGADLLLNPNLIETGLNNDNFLFNEVLTSASVDVTAANPNPSTSFANMQEGQAYFTAKLDKIKAQIAQWYTHMQQTAPRLFVTETQPTPPAQLPESTKALLDQAKQKLESGFVGGYNQGCQEGYALKNQQRQQAANAEKAHPRYVEGATAGKAAGMEVAMGTKTAAAGMAMMQIPETDGELYKKGFLEAFNRGFMEGRAGVKKQREDEKKNDPNYNNGEQLGYAIGTQLASKDKATAQAALWELGTLPNGVTIDQAGQFANEGKDKNGNPILGDTKKMYGKGYWSGFNRGYMGGRHAVKRQREQAITANMQNPHFLLGVVVAQLRVTALAVARNPQTGVINTDALNTSVDNNSLVQNHVQEAILRSLAKSANPDSSYVPASNSLQSGESLADAQTKFKDGYWRTYNNPNYASQAQQRQRAQEQQQLMQDPEYARGFADGDAAGKAKYRIREYEHYTQLSQAGQLSSTEAGELAGLQAKLGSQLDRLAEVAERVRAMEQTAQNAPADSLYKKAFYRAFNESYQHDRAEQHKREKEKNESAESREAALLQDPNTPKGKGFKRGKEVGLRVREVLYSTTASEEQKQMVRDRMQGIFEQAKADEATEGPGYAAAFQYGYNVGLMNAELSAGKKSKEQQLEQNKKDFLKKFPISKELQPVVEEQFKLGADWGEKTWYEEIKKGANQTKLNDKLGSVTAATPTEDAKKRIESIKNHPNVAKYKTNNALIQSAINAFQHGYEFGKKTGLTNGTAYKEGNTDALNGSPKQTGKSEEYNKGYRDGESAGGFGVFKSQMGLSEEPGAQEAANYGVAEGYGQDQKLAFQRAYRDAYARWTCIFYLQKGFPIPQKLESTTWDLTASDLNSDPLVQGTSNIGEPELSDREKAASYVARKDYWINQATWSYGKTQTIFNQYFEERLTAYKEENKRNNPQKTGSGADDSANRPTPSQTQSAYQEAMTKASNELNGSDDKSKAFQQELLSIQGYTDGYKKAVEHAEMTAEKGGANNKNYAVGFEQGYLKTSEKTLNNPISPNPIPSDISSSKSYLEGFDKGTSQGLKEKMNIAETTVESGDANLLGAAEAEESKKGYEKGKSDGETAKIVDVENAIKEDLKKMTDTEASAFRKGYEKGFFEKYNAKRGFLDGYYTAWGKEYPLGLLAAEHQQKDQDDYNAGYASGKEVGMSDKAVGIFNPDMENQVLETYREQEKNQAEQTKSQAEAAKKSLNAKDRGTTMGSAHGKEAKKKLTTSSNQNTTAQTTANNGRFTSLSAFLKEVIQKEGQNQKKQEMLAQATEVSPLLAYYELLLKNFDKILDEKALSDTTAKGVNIVSAANSVFERFKAFAQGGLVFIAETAATQEEKQAAERAGRESNVAAFRAANANSVITKLLDTIKKSTGEYLTGYDEGYDAGFKQEVVQEDSNVFKSKSIADLAKSHAEYFATEHFFSQMKQDSALGNFVLDLRMAKADEWTYLAESSSGERSSFSSEMDSFIGGDGSNDNPNHRFSLLELFKNSEPLSKSAHSELQAFIENLRYIHLMFSDSTHAKFISDLDNAFHINETKSASSESVLNVKTNYGQNTNQRLMIRLYEQAKSDNLKRQYLLTFRAIYKQNPSQASTGLSTDTTTNPSNRSVSKEQITSSYFSLAQQTEGNAAKRSLFELFVKSRAAWQSLGDSLQHVDQNLSDVNHIWGQLVLDPKFKESLGNSTPLSLAESAYKTAFQSQFSKTTLECNGKLLSAGTPVQYRQSAAQNGVDQTSSGNISSTTTDGEHQSDQGYLEDSLVKDSLLVKAFKNFSVLLSGLYQGAKSIGTVDEAALAAFMQSLAQNDPSLLSDNAQSELAQKVLDADEALKTQAELINMELSEAQRAELAQHLLRQTDYVDLEALNFTTNHPALNIQNTGVLELDQAEKSQFLDTSVKVNIPAPGGKNTDGIAFQSDGVIFDEDEQIIQFLKGTIVIPRLEGGKYELEFTNFHIDLLFDSSWMELIDNSTSLPADIVREWKLNNTPLMAGDLNANNTNS